MKFNAHETDPPENTSASKFPDKAPGDQQPSANDFNPIKIVGEPLSATVIRMRRERPY